jgi:hypothetical protein
MLRKAKNKRLLAAEGVLVGMGLEATAGWEDDEDKPALGGEGWWVLFTRVDPGRKLAYCKLLGEGEGEQRALTYEEVDEVMIDLQGADGMREIQVDEGWLGRSRFTNTIEMHPAILDYWRQEAEAGLEEDAPEGVMERIDRNDRERTKGAKRNRMTQRTLTGIQTSEPGRSLLRMDHEDEGGQAAVRCRLIYGQETRTEECSGGSWELGRGRAVWRPEKGGKIQVELAKILLWKHREAVTWEELSRRIGDDVREALETEERGFRMPAWQLLTQIRKEKGLTRLVGVANVMADVHFASWTGRAGAGACSPQDSLILLEALPTDQQMALVDRLTEGGDWAVVARGDGLEARAKERLDKIGHRQQLLPTEKRDGKPTPIGKYNLTIDT